MAEYPEPKPLTNEDSDEDLDGELDEEWVNKYLRGCKDITKPTDSKPHFLTKSGKEVVVDTTEKFEPCFILARETAYQQVYDRTVLFCYSDILIAVC